MIKVQRHENKVKIVLKLPSMLMYTVSESSEAVDKIFKSKRYWVSDSNRNNISQNKKYLAHLLKNFTVVEFGGWDGAVLKQVFACDIKHTYRYSNIDIGKPVFKMMENTFKDLDNVKFSLIKENFDDLKFLNKTKINGTKAFCFLQNTFNNYGLDEGNNWLKDLAVEMKNDDIFILGMDRRVAIKKHLDCYGTDNVKNVFLPIARHLRISLDNIDCKVIFQDEAIHGGFIATKPFIYKGQKVKEGEFIEIFSSFKFYIKDMIKRVEKCGFKLKRVLRSSDRHNYNLILAKK